MKKNQGFSLVELIVVVAIMAILVGVLAPAYLRYVEKSRKSTDVSAISEMMGAAEKVAIDPELTVPVGSKFNIAVGSGKVTLSFGAGSAGDDVLTEWKKVANATKDYEIKSADWAKVSGTFVGTVGADGDVTWSGGVSQMLTFSKSLKAKISGS